MGKLILDLDLERQCSFCTGVQKEHCTGEKNNNKKKHCTGVQWHCCELIPSPIGNVLGIKRY